MKGRHKVLFLGAAAGALMYLKEQHAKANERSLAGAVVAITGGSRGLGLALARALANEGCRIAICAREEKELEEATQDIEKLGAKVLPFTCDVTNRDQVEAFARAVTARFGQVDIWINNAAIIQIGPIQDMDVEDFKKAMDVNFWGKVYGSYAVLPQMLERGNGHIVNINSLGGQIGLPHMATYCAAKFAGQGFSENLTIELASKGIRVTTVSPGPLRTGSFTASEYTGNAEKEMEWFGGQASFPLPAPFGPLSAENAAQLIVRAIKRGTQQIVIPPIPFDILGRLHGLMPEVSLAVRRWINDRLPAPTGNSEEAKGDQLLGDIKKPVLKAQMQQGALQGATLNQ